MAIARLNLVKINHDTETMIYREVPEVCLVELLNVVAEEDLEGRVELAVGRRRYPLRHGTLKWYYLGSLQLHDKLCRPKLNLLTNIRLGILPVRRLVPWAP